MKPSDFLCAAGWFADIALNTLFGRPKVRVPDWADDLADIEAGVDALEPGYLNWPTQNPADSLAVPPAAASDPRERSQPVPPGSPAPSLGASFEDVAVPLIDQVLRENVGHEWWIATAATLIAQRLESALLQQFPTQ